MNVSIEAGTLNAIIYVLMHEATHIIDGSLAITAGRNSNSVPGNSFITGVWIDRTTISPAFNQGLLDSTRFGRGGKVLPIGLADSVYHALKRTPFVSLYSTSSWHEDLAEFLSVCHFTQRRKQPFRIVLYNKIAFFRSTAVEADIFATVVPQHIQDKRWPNYTVSFYPI